MFTSSKPLIIHSIYFAFQHFHQRLLSHLCFNIIITLYVPFLHSHHLLLFVFLHTTSNVWKIFNMWLLQMFLLSCVYAWRVKKCTLHLSPICMFPFAKAITQCKYWLTMPSTFSIASMTLICWIFFITQRLLFCNYLTYKFDNEKLVIEVGLKYVQFFL
jgi:hypothetical protein